MSQPDEDGAVDDDYEDEGNENFIFLIRICTVAFADDFIVDDDNRPLPKPSYRTNRNAP